jgi:DNA (cytosine-5)-methyltransferase 1
MRILDLFAGIGGFSLAGHWMGWKTVAFVEKDAFCQKVLRKNFGQDIEIYDDITTYTGVPGSADIVCGGFPCQPASIAGQRKGKNDERYLFPQMLRVVAEVRPAWVVAENVRGLLSVDDGELFEDVCSSLERIGYAVQSFCIPASAVSAPHLRDRVWIIAHADRNGTVGERRNGSSNHGKRDGAAEIQKRQNIESGVEFPDRTIMRREWPESWLETVTRLCSVDDGLPGRLVRPKGWRLSASKAAGNSVVPQIIFEIFRAIKQVEL